MGRAVAATRSGSPSGPTTSSAASRSAPNGRTLAAGNGDNGTVALWDVQSRHLIATLRTGNGGPVNSVAFSPHGHTLATGSENGTVQLWDPEATACSRRSAPARAKSLASRSALTDVSSPRQASPGRYACGRRASCGATS